jgi:Tfp pilus assembly protein PilN
MIDRELLQQALDALEKHIYEYETIQAIKTRLAQPEPMLVSPKEFIAAVTGKWDIQGIPIVMSAWPTSDEQLNDTIQKLSDSAALNSVPNGWVKTKEWVELTNEEIKQLMPVCAEFASFRAGVRAVEAIIKESK